MKIRSGFVSNSSSASFVVKKVAISLVQAELLRQHGKIAEMLAKANSELHDELCWASSDAWQLASETKDEICFDTIMTNFDLPGFARAIGIPEHAYTIEGDNY